MCISLAPVQFGKTVTGIHEAEDGTHVVFYQNVVGAPTAKSSPSTTRGGRRRSASAAKGAALPGNWQVASKARGNALVIPLVTGDFGSVELLRGSARTPNLLRDIRRTLLPPQRRSRGTRSLLSDSKGAVVIEQFDIYTIVRAENAGAIPNAVKAVEARKRPPLNQELFDALESWYGCPFAVACFNTDDDQGESKPIAFKYQPLYPDVFMIYTLDGHDGGVPDLNAQVELDHTVFASTWRFKADAGKTVRYADDIPTELKAYVPERVIGRSLPTGTTMVNGDILVPIDSVAAGQFEAYRVLPPNAPARDAVPLAEA